MGARLSASAWQALVQRFEAGGRSGAAFWRAEGISRSTFDLRRRSGRGRDGPHGPPPAQIPAGGITALGSYLGSGRQTAQWAKGEGCGPRGSTRQPRTETATSSCESAGYADAARGSKRVALRPETLRGVCHSWARHGMRSIPGQLVGATAPVPAAEDACGASVLDGSIAAHLACAIWQ
jgi:hypothetical protein